MTATRVRQWMLLAFATAWLTASVHSGGAATVDDSQHALIRRGSELWAAYCSNCHNAPPPGDRARHEWEVIELHMRVRANLPTESTRAIFAYLRAH